MDRLLEKGSSHDVVAGPFVSSTDGVTPSTGLTIGSSEVFLSKNSAATFVSKSTNNAPSHLQDGYYKIPLASTDTDTVGDLFLQVTSTGDFLPVRETFTVVEAHVYGGLVTSTDFLQVDAQQVGGATPDKSTDIADTLLGRNIAGGSSSSRIVTDALRILRNKWTISGTTLTVFQEDDTTQAWKASVSSSTGADNVTQVDPA